MVTRRARRPRALAAAAALLLLGAGARPAAHPLHTTLAEVRQAGPGGAVQVRIRAFSDDYGRAVAAARGATAEERERVYVGRTFGVRDARGAWVRFTWCGSRPEGEVTWICLRGTAAGGLRGGAVRNSMLFDLYADQVNVVRAEYAGRSRSLLFTPGDGPRRLP